MSTLTWLESVGSTQDELVARLADPAARVHGAAVGTVDQRAGRGRHGRVWTTTPGAALALSVHLAPTGPSGPLAPAHLSWVSLVVATAVARALAGRGVPVHVKWPNDVLVDDGRKVCGVLATVAPGGGVVVGMGVNLDHSAGAPAPTATALADWIPADRVPAPRELAEELRRAAVSAADALAAALDGVDSPVDGSHPALADVVDGLSTLGRRVRAELPGGEVLEGEAVGLGPGGVLRVRVVTTGRETLVREISAGDVLHLRGDVRRGR